MSLMHRILDYFTIVFIDDILVYSKSKEDHVEHLMTSLQLLREHRLYAKLEKCDFLLEKIALFRHVMSKDGLAVVPLKIKVIVNWQSRKNAIRIRSFLGLGGYYIRFVEGFSKISTLLTKLTRKNVSFAWTQE